MVHRVLSSKVVHGFPTSPPTGASWSFSTWKVEMPISSINLFGLFRGRFDLRGTAGLGGGDTLMIGVGIDVAMRRRRNLRLRTRILPLCVLTKYRRCGPMCVTMPYMSHRLVLYGYLRSNADFWERFCRTVVRPLDPFCSCSSLLLSCGCELLPLR